MDVIAKRIKNRDLKTAVVGLGYVGLPLLLLLSELGFEVIGIDNNAKKVNRIRKGNLDFLKNNPRAQKQLIKFSRKKDFEVSSNFAKIAGALFVFVTVDTPIDKNNNPDQTNISAAARDIAKYLTKGAIVVIESTVAPQTTRNVVIPILEKNSRMKVNQDFYVTACSERVRPNQDVFEDMKSFPRVIGSDSKVAVPYVKSMYQLITKGDIDIVDITTAEVIKTAENAFRDVKIAFANELAIICKDLNANFWQARELINKRLGYDDLLSPGLGVGGHCLPKDSWLLVSSVKKNTSRVITSARFVNSFMPNYIANLTKSILKSAKVNFKGAKILILGYTYIENCDDIRNSPSITLIENLKKLGAGKISVHDPYINRFNKNLYQMARDIDCIILAQKHNQYKNLNFSRLKKLVKNPLILDTKNYLPGRKCTKLGFDYHGLAVPRIDVD